LVVLSRNKGASVAAFSLEDLKDLYSIRIPLEGYGAFLATQAAGPEDVAALHALVEQMEKLFTAGSRWQLLVVNRQFYATFYAIAGRPRLYDLIMRHLDMAGLYRRMAFAMDILYANTVEEHLELLRVVEQGAAEEAERLTRSNLERTVATLVASWERGHVPGHHQGRCMRRKGVMASDLIPVGVAVVPERTSRRKANEQAVSSNCGVAGDHDGACGLWPGGDASASASGPGNGGADRCADCCTDRGARRRGAHAARYLLLASLCRPGRRKRLCVLYRPGQHLRHTGLPDGRWGHGSMACGVVGHI
jgi:hypothetical protein